jgi:RNA polymerase sigma-70 factor (ECF subfamily)
MNPTKEKGAVREFSAFFASTGPGMVAKAVMLCGNRQEAEDAVQEAYTEALRYWHRIGAYDSPEAWVYKVMRQRLWAAARRASRQVPYGADLTMPAPVQAGTEQTAEARAVLAALGALPGTMRFVVVMHCLNGLTQEEVARELGLARGTVAVYLHSARRQLEKTLGMTSAEHAGQPLVRLAAQYSLFSVPDVPADPLARGLRAAETWLREGLEDDNRIVPAILASVMAAENASGRLPRWRRRRERTAESAADD